MPWGSNEALLLSIIEKNEAVFAVSAPVSIGFGPVLAVLKTAKSRSALTVKRFIGETLLAGPGTRKRSHHEGPEAPRTQRKQRVFDRINRIFRIRVTATTGTDGAGG